MWRLDKSAVERSTRHFGRCPISGSSGMLAVQMEDEVRYATVAMAPSASIMWADGDVWIQKSGELRS